MSSSDNIRWRQRFENFTKAYRLLKEASQKPWRDFSDLEREGIIKRFEYTYELSWKMLKDWLFAQGFDEKTPRNAVKRSFEVEIISEDDCETFFKRNKERRLTTHTYEKSTAEDVLENIYKFYVPLFDRLFQTLESRKND